MKNAVKNNVIKHVPVTNNSIQRQALKNAALE